MRDGIDYSEGFTKLNRIIDSFGDPKEFELKPGWVGRILNFEPRFDAKKYFKSLISLSEKYPEILNEKDPDDNGNTFLHKFATKIDPNVGMGPKLMGAAAIINALNDPKNSLYVKEIKLNNDNKYPHECTSHYMLKAILKARKNVLEEYNQRSNSSTSIISSTRSLGM